MYIKKLFINNFRGYRNFTLNAQEKLIFLQELIIVVKLRF